MLSLVKFYKWVNDGELEKMIKAVIFDFWGTLVENGTYSPIKQTYKTLNLRLSFGKFVEIFERVFMTQSYPSQMDGLKKTIEAFNLTPKNFIVEKLIGIWNMNKLFAKPYSDVVPALEELKRKNIKIALVSNSPKDSTEYVLEKYKLSNLFDVVALSHNLKLLKTDKQMFEFIIGNLGVNKNEIVMIGDSLETDMEAAQQSEIKGILMDRRNNREYQPKIKTLDELEKYIT